MNSEPITRVSGAYTTMVCQGVIAGQFKGNIFSRYGWEMEFYAHGKDTDEIKDIVRAYLTTEYDATSISFFKRKGDIDSKFYARFTRGDM